MSPEDLEALQETLSWLAQPAIEDEEDGGLVGVELDVMAAAEGQPVLAQRLCGR